MKSIIASLSLLIALTSISLINVQVGFAGPDTETLPPTLLSPAASSSNIGALPIEYLLGEAPLPATVRIMFMQGATLSASLTMDTSTSVSTTIDPFASSIVDAHVLTSSGFPLSSGAYTVILSYQDALANPAASATNASVLISQATPTPSPTASPSPTATASPTPTPTPCVSSVALPKVKVKKKSVAVTISALKNIQYIARASPVGSPTRRTKTIRFTATSKRKYLITFLNLKAGTWSFYYSAKIKGKKTLSCAVNKNIAS